jgi:hypothetical protein
MPVHSFRTLLADLATVARNTVTTAITPNYPLIVVTRPTLFSTRRSNSPASVVASSASLERQIVPPIKGLRILSPGSSG